MLEQTTSHRRTHIRMFVSHSFDKYKGIWTLAIEGKLLIGSNNIDHRSARKVDREGVLSVRGGRIKKAKTTSSTTNNIDDDGDDGFGEAKVNDLNNVEATNEGDTPKTPSTGTSTSVIGGESSDRHATTAAALSHIYRIGEKEEDPLEPILFTHCFEKLEVTFRTIYQPRDLSSIVIVSSSSKKKKKKGGTNDADESDKESIDPKYLKSSDPTTIIWRKSGGNGDNSNKKKNNVDSHAFLVRYNNHFSERPPPPNMKFHSVVSKIKLYPARPGVGSRKTPYQNQRDKDDEPLYQVVHPVLVKRLFPRHGMENSSRNHGDKAGDAKPSSSEGLPLATAPVSAQSQSTAIKCGGITSKPDNDIPIENDVKVPAFLTYNEVVMCIFRYIQDKKLHDPSDRSVIICDVYLKEIFGMERINFGHLHDLLFVKNLIRRVGAPSPFSTQQQQLALLNQSSAKGGSHIEEPVMPVELTYIMNEQTTSPTIPTGFEEKNIDIKKSNESLSSDGKSTDATTKRKSSHAFPKDPDNEPTLMSFDMDIAVPSFYNYRARDVLRRVKKREFDYATCRTKARHLLMSTRGNEDLIKTRIEEAVTGQGYNDISNIPIFLALSRAAHPTSEARTSALIDARICDMISRVKEASRDVEMSWEAVDALASFFEAKIAVDGNDPMRGGSNRSAEAMPNNRNDDLSGDNDDDDVDVIIEDHTGVATV